MFQTKVVEKINSQFLPSITTPSPPPQGGAVYETMWKNIVEPGRLQMTIWRMRIACCIPKTANTQSEYVIFIAFFHGSISYANARQC